MHTTALWRSIYQVIIQSPYMNTNQVQEQNKFRQTLNEYLMSLSVISQNDFQFEYEPFKLYKLVCRRSGFQAVTNRNEWPDICKQIQGTSPIQLKIFYLKYLHPYQKKYYFGYENDDEMPNMIIGAPRKMIKSDNRDIKLKADELTNLQSEIARSLQQQQKSTKLFYLKKSKLNHSKAQSKKIIMGLQSYMQRKDLIYSLNMLMLYSVNNHFPFLFEHYQKIFTTLSNYTHSIYPAKTEQNKQDLRTITLIFRNLTMNPINLKYMLGTPIFQLFVNLFNTGFDNQCSKNIVDVMNGLVKVGWDCAQILRDIGNAILQDKFEDVEGSVELLRGLIDERDQNLAPAVTQNIKALLRVLMSNEVNVEVKEQVFQILAFVTDISSQSRQQLLKNDVLLSIIVGILQHMRNHEKLTQFVALTLSNMSSSTSAKSYLKNYESELMMIGFTDDSLAGIIANIMAELSNA